MHSYEYDPVTGVVTPRHDIDLREVKKMGYFASFTTKLKLPSSDFLDKWRQEKAIEYSRDNPPMANESLADYNTRIDRLIWQPRKRWDGVEFDSNEFGTHCHAEVERWHKDNAYEFDPDWELYCHAWPEQYDAIFRRFDESTLQCGAELMVACRLLKIGGTLDLLAEDHNGRYALCDFKMRPHKGSPERCARDKDCQQLMFGADILRRQMGLDYMPDVYSAYGCPETGNWFVKKWSDKMKEKHLATAISINLAYNVSKGFESLEDALDATQLVLQGKA